MENSVHCGEGIFVSDPSSHEEDSGWLLSFVYLTISGQSELWIFDAKSFRPKALARVTLPGRVPYGFHGTWVPTIANS